MRYNPKTLGKIPHFLFIYLISDVENVKIYFKKVKLPTESVQKTYK